MPLLLGTREGVSRLPDTDTAGVERVLATDGSVYGLAAAGGAWFAATAAGLYRSTDVDAWTGLELPGDRPVTTAVAGSPDDERIYVGTMPADLYVSDDGGRSWRAPAGFRAIDSRDRWWNPDVTPHVRALATHVRVPDRLVLGIDGGGVHVSDDRGETWTERRGGLVSLVHDVIALGPDEYVAATDAGVFWTVDGGRWWDYLYGDETEHRYFRGVFRDARTVFSGGARSHPPVWGGERGADGGLYRFHLEVPPEDRPSARSVAVERVAYPGEPREVVLCGTAVDGGLVAGTNAGRLLRLTDGDWATAAVLDSERQIRCLLPY